MFTPKLLDTKTHELSCRGIKQQICDRFYIFRLLGW